MGAPVLSARWARRQGAGRRGPYSRGVGVPEIGLAPGSFRPLQIPTCRKRCLGAYWAAEVGP
eukprot:4778587-Lingulodinium_polyedra.AAC.1